MPAMAHVLDQLDRFGPDHCEPLNAEQASRYVADLAKTHYENFHVVSRLLPRELVADFRHVYSFCRWADDLGDETGSRPRSRELLRWWQRELDACYREQPRHPVFVALHGTIKRHDIPREPFDDLIDAFLQDQDVQRYDTWSQVVDYCARSANPVGRLVLYLCGYRDAERQRLSDATCTALQLANFWQDVRRDVVERNRVYIPRDVAGHHGLDIEQMAQFIGIDAKQPAAACASCVSIPNPGLSAILPAYRATLRDLVDRTWSLFGEGRKLWPLVRKDVRLDIRLFTLGGEAVLRKIERRDYDTLSQRPKLSKLDRLRLFAWAWWVTRWEKQATKAAEASPAMVGVGSA